MMFTLRLACLLALSAASLAHSQSFSPVAANIASEGSAMGAMAASRQSLHGSSSSSSAPLPRVFSPTLPRASYTRYPWKTEITATVFWCGELPTQNNPTPNTKSSWDTAWMQSFGGYDNPDPTQRVAHPEYRPTNFVPQQNPFYIALPYNDVLNHKTTKPSALKMIPWIKQTFERHGKSVCRDRWVAIRVGNRICYAQWSDCGPFLTDDVDYVFGNARPQNEKNDGAGIDVSPAVRDYLGMSGKSKCDWRFVDVHEVPDGPWRRMGQNNHFVQNQKGAQSNGSLVANRLEELRRQRDAYHRKFGNEQIRAR
ncbi:hypothetical protein [Phragmitibacter flavus]|uniref:hypothetical protein n=1 Tax=Phragmitibacter flavus TaxID=2576071 RepID=UPI001F0E07AF|nr:hypothetical protein [Phragmitibacter flavus]